MTDRRTKFCGWCGEEYWKPFNMTRSKYCGNDCNLAAKRAWWNNVEGRFWSFVVKGATKDDCWGWSGQKRWDGYGRFAHQHRPLWAHRYSWTLHNGQIPEGMHVLHSCDNPACSNPRHLRLGTHAENMAESKAKGRNTRGEKTHRNKLTEAQARAILESRGHATPKELAALYHVGRGAITAIWRGEAWKHIQEAP